MTIARIWGCITLTPMPWRQKVKLLLNPLDATRYIEIPFFLKSLSLHNVDLVNKNVLDVSSPYIPAYLLAKTACVIKTDITPAEKTFITAHKRLVFEVQDALHLTYADRTFDLTYAISVIEHIYIDYNKALEEIFRVTKPKGWIYISFPIARSSREEWLTQDNYGHQYKRGNDVFFQYVFNAEQTEHIMQLCKRQGEIKEYGLFFEREEDGYDRLTHFLRRSKLFPLPRNSIINGYYGLCCLKGTPCGFDQGKGIGVACLFIKKRTGEFC